LTGWRPSAPCPSSAERDAVDPNQSSSGIIAAKRLFLLRHAKSSHDDPSLADRERPLAPRGRRAAKAMSAHLRERGIRPALVLCSPATRARQTLTGIAPALDGSDVRIEPEMYEASARGLLACLQAIPSTVPSAMMIGHNPAIERLALDLAASGPDLTDLARKYPTGALATLELTGDWSELDADRARLVDFVQPRELG
jgi:phosphohistidine phosphatase